VITPVISENAPKKNRDKIPVRSNTLEESIDSMNRKYQKLKDDKRKLKFDNNFMTNNKLIEDKMAALKKKIDAKSYILFNTSASGLYHTPQNGKGLQAEKWITKKFF
jgi:hypothetical protein